MKTVNYTRDDLATASIMERRTVAGKTVFVAYTPCDCPEVFNDFRAADRLLTTLGFRLVGIDNQLSAAAL